MRIDDKRYIVNDCFVWVLIDKVSCLCEGCYCYI